MHALVVNAGSTSLKLSLANTAGATQSVASLDDAFALADEYEYVIHRVVHGGGRDRPAAIDDDLVVELTSLSDLAPLHQPPALELIARCRAQLPEHEQYAVFDTSFHTTIPAAASTYALPARWRERVRVHGFHGISHAWSARCLNDAAPGVRRVAVAHLGGGASLCAVRDGDSVMTSMGFTPLDGLVMATRSGALDPGAVLWLAQHSDDDVLEVLERQSGLLGLCGDADMQRIEQRCDDGDAEALLALDVYLHRLVTSIGACVACLGGIDALVFTGGVGEGSAKVRDLTCERLEWLGTRVRPTTIDGARDVVELTDPGAPVRTFVVHAREDVEMVHQVSALLDRP